MTHTVRAIEHPEIVDQVATLAERIDQAVGRSLKWHVTRTGGSRYAIWRAPPEGVAVQIRVSAHPPRLATDRQVRFSVYHHASMKPKQIRKRLLRAAARLRREADRRAEQAWSRGGRR